MKRLNGITALFLSLAFLWSAALTVLAFVVDIPIRAGSRNLVQTASGGIQEAKVLPQTYFQAYGVPSYFSPVWALPPPPSLHSCCTTR